jgi:hypothetical protein
MYGPPPCRKRKVRIAGRVCAYVYGLVGVFTYDNVAFRYLSADQHPDHDTLAAFRQEHVEALAELFVQALRLCQKAGVGDCIKVGGGTRLVVVEEVVVGTSAATRGRAFRADCRGRRNEPGGEGGRPLL